MLVLEAKVKSTFRDAACKLTGPKKRAFMAGVAVDYFEGSARKTERVLGWNRHSVQLGLHEREAGVTCLDNYQARGRQRTEETLPNLVADIHKLVSGQSQADPKFKTVFSFLAMRGSALNLSERPSLKRAATARMSCPVARRWVIFSIGWVIA